MENTEQLKHCSRCSTDKPLADFGNNKSKKDGLNPICKMCVSIINKENKKRFPERTKELQRKYNERNKEKLNAKQREYRQRNKEKINAKRQAETKPDGTYYNEDNPIKRCYKCNTDKSPADFYKNKHKYDGLTSECKACIAIINKENKKRFPERTKRLQQKYVERHKEEIRQRSQQYYVDNRDIYLERQKEYAINNPEKHKETIYKAHKKYRELHPEREYQYRQSKEGKYVSYKGNAKKKGIEFLLSSEEFYTFWQKPCTYCGIEINTVGIDRVDSKKGYHIDNCVSCCPSCNSSKADRSLSEWLESLTRILEKSKTD